MIIFAFVLGIYIGYGVPRWKFTRSLLTQAAHIPHSPRGKASHYSQSKQAITVMKKFILSALCSLTILGAATHQAAAQDVFSHDDQVLSVGVGLSSSTYETTFPPLSITYERSVADRLIQRGSFGLGGVIEFRGYTQGSLNGSAIFIGPRASFHYEFVDNLDTYIAAHAGFHYQTRFVDNDTKSKVGFMPYFTVGIRYALSPGFGIFGEVGTGISVLKVGASFSF